MELLEFRRRGKRVGIPTKKIRSIVEADNPAITYINIGTNEDDSIRIEENYESVFNRVYLALEGGKK